MYGQVDIGLIPGRAESPWQYYQNGCLALNLRWDYTMGYRFTPLKDGQITKLGGCFMGAKSVYLWDSSQQLLASATVNANNKWSYTEITPVSLKAGQTYTVAVYLGGTGGSYRYYIERFPQIYENIKIESSCFAPGNGYPVTDYTYAMYGQADIEFVEDNQ